MKPWLTYLALGTTWAVGLALVGCSSSHQANPTRDPSAPVIPSHRDAGNAEDDASTGPSCKPPEYLLIEPKGSDAAIRMGWKGVGHGIRLNNGISVAVKIFDCDDECRNCRFTGPVDLPDAPVNNQRCVNNTVKTCSSKADCGGGDCRYFLGPSVPVQLPSDLQICAITYFEPLATKVPNGSILDDSPIQGTIDLGTGSSDIRSLNVKIVTALTCATCAGDPTPFDGKAQGTCEGTAPMFPPVTQACDVQGITPLGAKSSYECPQWGGDVTPVAIQLAPLRTSDTTWTLGADSPPCADAPDKKCMCGTCDMPAGKMCHTDGDCAGHCLAASKSKPDACTTSNVLCLWDPQPQPPFLQCDDYCHVTDADRGIGKCAALVRTNDWSLILEGSGCFTDDGLVGNSIRAKGVAEPFKADGSADVTLAALSCMPPSNSALVGQAFGLPGPASIELPVKTSIIGGDGSWLPK